MGVFYVFKILRMVLNGVKCLIHFSVHWITLHQSSSHFYRPISLIPWIKLVSKPYSEPSETSDMELFAKIVITETH